MTQEDRARAAERLLDDPLVTEIIAAIEDSAIEAMLKAETDEARRDGRDTVLTIRALRKALEFHANSLKEAKRPRPSVV